MNKLIKLIVSLALLLGLSGCNASTTTTNNATSDTTQTAENTQWLKDEENNEQFDKICNEIFIDMIKDNYFSIISTFEKPQDYGIDLSSVEATFGTISDSDYEEEIKITQGYIDQIKSIDYDSLSTLQQNEYDTMVSSLENSITLASEKYRYFNQLYTPISNIYEDIATNLVNISVHDEVDARNLISLMESVDEYIDSSLEFIDIQIEKGLFWSDIDSVLDYCNNMIDLDVNSSTIVQIEQLINDSELSEALKDEYIQKAIDAYKNHILVAYQHIVDKFKTLDDSVCNQYGIAHYENGKEYYELLMVDTIGLSDSIESIESMVNMRLNTALNDLITIAQSNSTVLDLLYSDSLSTGFDDPKEMIEYLYQQSSQDFPEIELGDYNIVALDSEMTNSSILAYFYGIALDQSEPMQIRYNPSSNDVGSVDFFTTVAHEGVAGHMYNYVYVYDNDKINNLAKAGITYSGFVEGYATYVELYSTKYLSDSINQDVLDAWVDNTVLNDMIVALSDLYINYEGYTLEQYADAFEDYITYSSAQNLYDTLINSPITFNTYYLGYAKIIQLKENAQEQLGDKFDEKQFHTALLCNGFTNFDVISKTVDAYIQANK